MKKLAILGSAIAFFLLSNVATHSKAMAQYTQKQKTNTEQVAEDTNKPESEQEQNSTDKEQETEDSTNKPESTSNGGY
jgi:hypothetical protein